MAFPAKTRAFWPLIVVFVIADYASKRAVEARLALHEPYVIIGDWVRFTLTYNRGAAMNMSLGDYSRVAFTLIAGAMLVLLYRMYRQARDGDLIQAVALGLVSAGALGNLLDRLRSARGVVDFIDVGVGDSRFYTFNVADSCVTVGAILLAWLLWLRPENDPPVESAAQ
jgi:signal peptidase II